MSNIQFPPTPLGSAPLADQVYKNRLYSKINSER